ncbi:MAG TPA: VTT domain-containing protein [Myxococcales bacterium]
MDTVIAARGLWVVVSLVFASGLGLPVPSAPVLLGAGVLAGSGRFSLGGVIAGAFLAHLATDFVWYGLGRWRGQRILALLCRISLEPDTCVQRTGDLFARRQSTALVISKFVPGLRIVAAPLAGMLRMPVAGFATWDGLGTLLWVGALSVLGYLFSESVTRAAAPAARLGPWLVLAVLVAFAAWLGWKSLRRRGFLRDLRVARITPEELHSQMEAGDRVTVIDLRSPLADMKVRGALQMAPHELERRHAEIPRDRDVVLYCNCPNEASAANMALRLRQRGIMRVRPLLGGLEAWQERGYPVESVQASLGPALAGATASLH